MKKQAVKRFQDRLRGTPPDEVLAIAESLYARARTEIADGKQYSKEDIRRINDARKSIQRFKERLKWVGK